MTRRRAAATQAIPAPVTLNKPKFRVPAMRGAGGITAQMMAMQHEVAAPYETAAKQSRLPNVGNPGPIALANFQARNRSLSRHFMRTDSLYRSIHNNSALAIVGTGPDAILRPIEVEQLRFASYAVEHLEIKNPAGVQYGEAVSAAARGKDSRLAVQKKPTKIDLKLRDLTAEELLTRHVYVAGKVLRSPKGIDLGGSE